jgi:hypothetical protein
MMSTNSPRRSRFAALLVLAVILLAHSSCNFSLKHDPAKTVTVEIIGVDNEDDRDEIRETLKGMADGSSHLMTSSSSGEKMTVKLSPVSDVQAFSRKINFGEVTQVDGRTVRVEFVK